MWVKLIDVPVGSKFWVNNGHWDGKIVEEDGVKCVFVYETERIIKINNDDELDISIYKSE